MRLSLTYDDGPSTSCTEQLLEVLAQYNAPATFFMCGTFAHQRPDLVQSVLSAGHVIGNHTSTHPDLRGLNRKSVDEELDGGVQSPFFRPPFGSYSADVVASASARNMRLTLWDIDSFDWALSSAAEIESCVASQVGDGGIILMHDGDFTNIAGKRHASVEATRRILSRYTAEGCEFVPLTGVALPGTPRKTALSTAPRINSGA